MIKERIDVIVPKGVRYISEWQEFKFRNFPAKCIINKVLPGCGFTEYCLTGEESVILASPRKILLQNKHEQHPNDTYLVINELDPELNVDKDIDREPNGKKKHQISDLVDDSLSITEEQLEDASGNSAEVNVERSKQIYDRIYRDIFSYREEMHSRNKPMKILVTYDSYHMVSCILRCLNVFDQFHTIIDEFQTILHDSRFKSDVELSFLDSLGGSHSALFVSATPILGEYLDMLAEFDGLPYFELNWSKEDPMRIKRPDLRVQTLHTVNTKVTEIVNKYLSGSFEKATLIRDGGDLVEVISDEAVFYLNSVNHIIRAVRRNKLHPDQVNILCSNTEANQKLIKSKLGKSFSIGKVPLRGEKPKMFTFCTRTVYLGADFYSTCARSFILSDSNIETLAVDISEDLPQILGRQRLDENPWKNTATFFYKSTCDPRKVPQEVFDKLIENKKASTQNLLDAFRSAPEKAKNDLSRNYQKVAKSYNYRDDYVSVSEHSGNLQPIFNNLVLVNEIRAYKIQQIDYKDRFSVFSTLSGASPTVSSNTPEFCEFIKEYDETKDFSKKLRLLCESNLSDSEIKLFLDQLSDSDRVKMSYLALGPAKLRGMSYRWNLIEPILQTRTFNRDILQKFFLGNFSVGGKIPLLELKTKLGEFYKSVGYDRAPKASDILEWYEVKKIKFTVISGQPQVNGYRLLSVKPEYQEVYDKLHKS